MKETHEIVSSPPHNIVSENLNVHQVATYPQLSAVSFASYFSPWNELTNRIHGSLKVRMVWNYSSVKNYSAELQPGL